MTELVHRKHPHIPGEDVGQLLVLGKSHDTLGEVLSKIAGHGIHRWDNRGRACKDSIMDTGLGLLAVLAGRGRQA